MTKRRTEKSGGEPAGDFMEVGKEVAPGMRLRCICHGHTDTIGRITWSHCGRFIASPFPRQDHLHPGRQDALIVNRYSRERTK
uniref:Uncharacterized protein n=1 Tax=Candidatus Kentrum sp. MB TaxID=2138164 RepID=A0A451BFC8_9GAMM|nr:MAG: hypothetical protein BECKMB1821G_GA0114241_110116 [Candidatus Kentron sp. MB]VFK35133.1 MAG: hypothetical protein BECKMB1821I_GA0114274_110117 [Candidatus Kentron sp. MB]VFK76995.1 MAG: hypothetical protein BECKMB1821H_GA0114242_108817 [Candidatus Kentron sp. MB]